MPGAGMQPATGEAAGKTQSANQVFNQQASKKGVVRDHISACASTAYVRIFAQSGIVAATASARRRQRTIQSMLGDPFTRTKELR